MKKILLVNNQEAFLDRNKTLLNRAGFLIRTATSVKEALDLCWEQPVDLIISQLDMPERGGDQLCAQIRQEPRLKDVSIILICYNSEPELGRASTCGANAVVTKPVHPGQLLKLVGKFLGIPARRDYRAAFNARVEGTSGSHLFSGMTRNVSVSGLLCESSTLLKPEDEISNLFFVLESERIVSDGTVVWSAPLPEGQFKYGVRFTGLAQELRDKIENFVAAPPEEA